MPLSQGSLQFGHTAIRRSKRSIDTNDRDRQCGHSYSSPVMSRGSMSTRCCVVIFLDSITRPLPKGWPACSGGWKERHCGWPPSPGVMNQGESGNLDLLAAALDIKEDSLQGAKMTSHEPKWFANRGQMLQLGMNAVAVLLSAKGAWSDLATSRFFSLGAILFYLLIGLVLVSVYWMLRSNRAVFAAAKGQTISKREKPPTIWVSFTPAHEGEADPENWQALTFSKDGDRPIRSIQLGPLVWRTEERVDIELHNVIGPLREAPAECKFSLHRQDGVASRRYELPVSSGVTSKPAIEDHFKTGQRKHHPGRTLSSLSATRLASRI